MAGGRGNDVYRFTDAWGVDRVTESAVGGTGDRLDFSAVTANLALTKGSAITAVSGANKMTATGIDAVGGGLGTSTLTIPAGNNLFTLNGYQSGTAGKLSFAGIDALVGGSGADIVKVVGHGSLNSFDGGGGRNTLDFSAADGNEHVNLKRGTANAVHSVARITTVIGTAFADILVGDDAANVLMGGGGRDMLIGGKGADTLDGGAGDDILVAGYVAPENQVEFPYRVLGYWINSSADYNARVTYLSTTGYLGQIVNNTMVFNDTAKDSLIGAEGQDWFVTSVGDLIKDKATDETITAV